MITINKKDFRAAVAICHSPEQAVSADFGLIAIGRQSEDGWISFDATDDIWRVSLMVPAAGASKAPPAFAADAGALRYIAAGMGEAIQIEDLPGRESVDFYADTLAGLIQTSPVPGDDSAVRLINRPAVFGANPAHLWCRADALADALDLVWQAASYEEARYYLNGVYLERMPSGEVGLTATDGHKMMHAELGAQAGGKWPAQILPRLCVARLIAFLRWIGAGETVKVTAGENVMRFESDDGRNVMDIQPLDGSFPDWQRVIPAEDDAWSYRIDVRQFQTAVRRLVRGRRRRGARMLSWAGAIELDSATITMHGPLHTERGAVPTMVRAAAHLIRGNRRIVRGVNLNYLRTVADLLEGAETARVCSPHPGGPIVFRGDNSAVVVLMPMRSDFERFGIEGVWE